jgi:hypothetical protein
MLGHHDAARITRVVSNPQHEPGDLGPRRIFLPSAEWAVFGVRVHVYIVAIIDPQFPGIVRIHVQLMVAEAGQPAIPPVRVAEIGIEHQVPINRRPG